MTELQALAPALILLVLGAASPGPSLAVVVRNTVTGGRWQGLQCAVGHGLGFGLYALAVVFGLAEMMRKAPVTFNLVQGCGGLLLIYLAWQSFHVPTPAPFEAYADAKQSPARGFVEGFLTAILNPKIALFFLAVFSSVLHEELADSTQLAMALAGWLIDTTWYAFVAMALSTRPALDMLRRQARLIDLAMGVVFIALAIVTLVGVFEFWVSG